MIALIPGAYETLRENEEASVPRDRRDRAIVMGGSIAGLVVARVLSESHREVVVLDRDTVDGVDHPRRGVPQGPHVHGLMARGQQVLEELFPGFTAAAERDGVPLADLGTLRWFFDGVRPIPVETGLTCVSTTRPRLEHFIREWVRTLPNVRLEQHVDVTGFVTDPEGRRVIGVSRTASDQPGDVPATLTADLVVDATGRGSRTPAWLEELGFPRPTEESIGIGLSYTTRRYRLRHRGAMHDDLAVNPVSSPSCPRGAFLVRIEDEQFLLSQTGVLGDGAPVDADGFAAYASSLPVPDVREVLATSDPMGEPVRFRYPASRWRRYDRLRHVPDGLIVMGDALCSFNPVYGQGMTVAALEALEVRDHLRRRDLDVRSLARRLSRVVSGPWAMSAAGDLSFDQVQGDRTLAVRIGNAYMAKVREATLSDPVVARAFIRVMGAVASTGSLMRPGILVRVLRARLTADTRRRAPRPEPRPEGADDRAVA